MSINPESRSDQLPGVVPAEAHLIAPSGKDITRLTGALEEAGVTYDIRRTHPSSEVMIAADGVVYTGDDSAEEFLSYRLPASS